VVLADGNHTIDTTMGDEFELGDPTVAGRVITLTTTTAPVPQEDETISIVIPHISLAAGGGSYTVKREDGTIICTMSGPVTIATCTVTAIFRFSSGVWRLGPNSGPIIYWDGAANVVRGIGFGAGA
jgi:hypothetical protein